MNYPAYPEYKDSGVQWVNNLPNGWRSAPVWTLFRRTKALGFPDHELLSVYRDHGVVPKSSRDDNFNKPSDDLSAYQLVKRGFLVVNKMKAWQGSISVSGHEGIVSPAYYVYAPTCDQNLRYMHFALRSSPMIASYASISSGVRPNQWDLDPQTFSRLQVPLPPLAEQSAIADFLDRETAKIDALIGKQEQLIATLREDRIATITHAVTKGLDPNAEMKDSGVEWLGEIPAHWEASRLKFVVKSVDSGTSVNAGDWTPSADEIGVLKTSCVSTGRFNAAGSKTVVDPEEIGRVTCPVRGGSLIVNRANTPQLVGSTGYAEVDYPNLYLSDKLWQVRFRSASAKFIHLWSQTEAYRSQIAAKCVGASSSMQNLSMGDFRDIAFGLPPMPEQQLIVEHLDTHCAKLDALIAKSELMIGVLREYRSALITDAVTGKIDVRGAA